MKAALAIVAALLAVAGNVPYLQQTWKGRVKPHPYTWLVGSIVSGTVLLGMLDKGAGIGSLPVAVSEAFTIVIFLFSLKFGFTKITRSDKLFLALALAGLIPWFVTKDPTLSVVVAVGVDLLSLVPTFRKSWKYPQTESPILFGSNVLRHILALASLQTYNVATTLHSIAMIISNTALVAVISRKKAR
ncbi:MAG TPA: hypothetical protein VG984_01185 [Candidatus Paceibacterota bacterium]|nr:hypothetical protein [Candidatus Paceibacterota bacterium]